MKSLLLAALLLTASPALAFDDSDRAAIEQAAARFSAAFVAGDYDSVIDFTPPRVMAEMAKSVDRTPEALRPLVIDQTMAAMSQMTLHTLTLDTRRMKPGTTSSGIDYAFIPTKMVSTPKGGFKRTKRAQTLALIEAGRVYMINIETDQQLNTLRLAYPSFKEVKAPR